jgi:spore germination protein
VNLLNLQPLLTTPGPAFWKGSLHASSLFQSSFIIAILIPYMVKPKEALKAGAAAIFFSGGIYLLIVIACVGMFGAEETKLLIYPTLETARSSAIGESLLERLDALFIIIWVISVYTTVYTTYYLAAYTLQYLFALKDLRMASTCLLPVLFGVSMVPDNIFQTYSLTGALGVCGAGLLTGYPLLLWIIYIFRRLHRRLAA